MTLTLGAPFFRVLCGRVGGEAALLIGTARTCNPPYRGRMKLPSLDVRPRMRDSGVIVAAGWLRWHRLERRGNHGVHGPGIPV